MKILIAIIVVLIVIILFFIYRAKSTPPALPPPALPPVPGEIPETKKGHILGVPGIAITSPAISEQLPRIPESMRSGFGQPIEGTFSIRNGSLHWPMVAIFKISGIDNIFIAMNVQSQAQQESGGFIVPSIDYADKVYILDLGGKLINKDETKTPILSANPDDVLFSIVSVPAPLSLIPSDILEELQRRALVAGVLTRAPGTSTEEEMAALKQKLLTPPVNLPLRTPQIMFVTLMAPNGTKINNVRIGEISHGSNVFWAENYTGGLGGGYNNLGYVTINQLADGSFNIYVIVLSRRENKLNVRFRENSGIMMSGNWPIPKAFRWSILHNEGTVPIEQTQQQVSSSTSNVTPVVTAVVAEAPAPIEAV